jgi:16S rRNA (adenine1518-N6/adenine1519-N6)-dimethyltransferase
VTDDGPLLPTSPARVRTLLESHGLRPSRALGQNFLADPNVAARIVRLAHVEPGDRVVEIGPGIGALTLALTDAGADVLCIEIDGRLVPILEEVLAGRTARVLRDDALTLDWCAALGDDRWTLVSNLPYNVATPVVLRALDGASTVERMLVMVQREVGERLAAAPGDAAYGAVSVKVAYHARARVVGRVPPTVFVPRPRVESALVRLDRHAAPPVDVDHGELVRVVTAGFATRRKTLRNALRPLLGLRVESVLDAAGIEAGARAEELGLEQWAAIAEHAQSS